MRWRTVFEGLQHVTKLRLSLLGGDAQGAEHALLLLSPVHADASPTDLPAVTDDVVGLGSRAARIGLQQGPVLVQR